jgi:hypothetical protein
MLKAYKFRINPTQEQQAKLVQHMGCVRSKVLESQKQEVETVEILK